MITKDDLLANGYKYFTQRNVKEWTNEFYQKLIKDSKGKKFYITVASYNNSKFPDIAKISGDYSYAPDVQFTSGGVTFNVDMLAPESVEQMEGFFDKLWYQMRCDYYEEL